MAQKRLERQRGIFFLYLSQKWAAPSFRSLRSLRPDEGGENSHYQSQAENEGTN